MRIIERNGSLVLVEHPDGRREWVDYREVDGWRC